MTGNTQVLTQVEKLAPIPVTLPDGNINHATCVRQDLPTRMPIGVDKWCGGVYYFHFLDKLRAHSIKGDRSGDLWHSRLGHPSKIVLRLVSGLNKSPFIFYSNKTCSDACMR
ncbi:unnamed protein product, partial [Cuscuta europaea]